MINIKMTRFKISKISTITYTVSGTETIWSDKSLVLPANGVEKRPGIWGIMTTLWWSSNSFNSSLCRVQSLKRWHKGVSVPFSLESGEKHKAIGVSALNLLGEIEAIQILKHVPDREWNVMVNKVWLWLTKCLYICACHLFPRVLFQKIYVSFPEKNDRKSANPGWPKMVVKEEVALR